MKLKMMILAATLMAAAALICAAEDNNDKTLSPYFHVKSADSSVEQFPLESTDVDARIAGVIADVVVVQTYRNTGAVPIEAEYVFPGSTRAAVYGMVMTVGERRITAKIKEKEAAKEIYEKARAEGKTASLLQQRRPNVFTMNVANILPGDVVRVELRYTELLEPRDKVYGFVYPTVVGPRYSNENEAEAPEDNRWVASPYLPEGTAPVSKFTFALALDAGLPVQDIRCRTHALRTQYETPERVRMDLNGGDDTAGNRDLVVEYRLSGGAIQTGLLLHRGEEENFFLLMAQPPARTVAQQIPPRDYVFVVDVSGSMNGFPLQTSKEVLRHLLARLRPGDTFNLLFFAGGSFALSDVPVPADAGNLQRALEAIDRQEGGGGTELLPALEHAYALPRQENTSRSIVVITDGYISVEAEAFEIIRDQLSGANVFAFGIGAGVNRHLIEGMARAGAGEPFVVEEPGQAAEAVKKFVDYVSTPVLTGIEVKAEGFDMYDVEPPSQPDLLADRPVLVFGKWKGEPQGSLVVTGHTGHGPFRQVVPVAGAGSGNPALRYLWARHRIATLGDLHLLSPNDERRQAITNLGLTYNLLTQFTSFVAVDEVVRTDRGAQQVKQPLPLPLGVGNLAVGAEVGSTPEPSTVLLLVLALLILWGANQWRRVRTPARA